MKSYLFIWVAKIVSLCVCEGLHVLTLGHILLTATDLSAFVCGVAAVNVVMLLHHCGMRMAHETARWLERINWLALSFLSFYLSFVDLESNQLRSCANALPIFLAVSLTFYMNVTIAKGLGEMLSRQKQVPEEPVTKTEKSADENPLTGIYHLLVLIVFLLLVIVFRSFR